eukprot:1245578-Prymnesium_polylepis.2
MIFGVRRPAGEHRNPLQHRIGLRAAKCVPTLGRHTKNPHDFALERPRRRRPAARRLELLQRRPRPPRLQARRAPPHRARSPHKLGRREVLARRVERIRRGAQLAHAHAQRTLPAHFAFS